MKVKLYFFIVIALFGMNSCKKTQTSIESRGVSFYPTKKRTLTRGNFYFDLIRGETVVWAQLSFRGANFRNGVLYLPYYNHDTTYFQVDGTMDYDFSKWSVKLSHCLNPDTAKISYPSFTNTGNYIAGATDYTKGYRNRIMLLDNNFNPIKQALIIDGIANRNFYNLELLENGNILSIYDGNGGFKMNCRDPDLKNLWTKSIAETPLYLVHGQNALVFFTLNKLEKFNYSGISQKAITLPSNYFVHNMVKTENGFMILGSYLRADKYDDFFIRTYDMDLNLVQSNTFETSFISSNPNYKIFQRSNILVEPDGYYFVVNLRNPEDFSGNSEHAFLLKINKNLEPVFHSSIDNRRVKYENSYLVRYNNELLCVGPAKWNGQDGYSFIRMDIEGNIIK